MRNKPSLYMSMLETAEIVAERYDVSREDQDAYALQSQQRTAAAQDAGKFDDEIVPMTTSMGVMDKETKEISFHDVTLEKDEGNRPSTTLESLAGLQPVFKDGQSVKEGQHITAGNASQLSDGASASVIMEASLAEKRGLEPLGRYVGVMAAGLEPDEMGIGPIYAVPRLLGAHGLKMDDIGLWELNEAFACQVLHSARVLGIPNEILNVNGGAISVGHPYGMSRCPHGRSRPDRGQAPGREIRGLHHVRRRRHGRGGGFSKSSETLLAATKNAPANLRGRFPFC